MLLRQLEYLTALAREGHFSTAAAACHVSQPALSAGIRKLEAELGVQLVRRGQRFEGLTPEGTEVLKRAQSIIAERDALTQALSAMGDGLSGVLRIGAIPTALNISAMLTTSLRSHHPLVRFSLESMTSREIVSGLNSFDLDVGVTYIDGEPLGRVRVVPLYRERYLFLTPADGKHAGRTTVSWADAAAEPLCLLVPSMQNRRIIDGYFAEAGAEAQPVVETDDITALYAHAAAMGLCSIIPHAWLHGFGIPEGTVVIPLPRPKRSFHVGLVLAGSGPESLLARALLDVAAESDLHEELNRAAGLRS